MAVEKLRKNCLIIVSISILMIIAFLISTYVRERFLSKKQTALIQVNCSIVLGKTAKLLGLDNGPLGPHGWEDTAYTNNFTEAYRKIGVNFIRIHDLWEAADIDVVFPDFNKDPYDEASYSFSSTDRHIAAMLRIEAQVIYRLGYSWSSPPKNNPPADYEKWATVCLQIVKHYNEGWAHGMNRTVRYWEVWNEPDIKEFWNGTLEEYFRLYDIVARKIKEYDSSLLVGGPTIAWDLNFLESFLQKCRDNGTPLDFVSWHIYTKNPYEIYSRAISVRSLMDEYGFSDKMSIITEWNIWKEESEPYEIFEKERSASFIASALTYLQDAKVDIATFYRGDSWPWGGIFKDDGTPRKAYYVFIALGEILENSFRVNCSTDMRNQPFATMAAKSEDGKTVFLVVSNYGSEVDSHQVRISNLPWNEHAFTYELYVIDENTSLDLLANGEGAGNIFEFGYNIKPYAVHILKLKVK